MIQIGHGKTLEEKKKEKREKRGKEEQRKGEKREKLEYKTVRICLCPLEGTKYVSRLNSEFWN